MPLCEITPLLSRERSLFCCCMLHDLMPFVDAHAAEALSGPHQGSSGGSSPFELFGAPMAPLPERALAHVRGGDHMNVPKGDGFMPLALLLLDPSIGRETEEVALRWALQNGCAVRLPVCLPCELTCDAGLSMAS